MTQKRMWDARVYAQVVENLARVYENVGQHPAQHVQLPPGNRMSPIREKRMQTLERVGTRTEVLSARLSRIASTWVQRST
jgi:hypothetical protein